MADGASAGAAYMEVLPELGGFGTALRSGLSKAFNDGGLKALGAAAGAALAVGAFKGLESAIDTTTELAGSVKSLQRVTGLAAEDASRLVFVGNELGISTDQLNQGFGLLAKNIVNASGNFTKYGIETTNADGSTRSLTQILGDASDKYVEIGGGLEGAAFAMNVFGRSGKTLIPILARGSEGIRELMSEADELGVVLGQEDVDSARELVIAQRELGEAFTGLGVSIGTEVIPYVTDLVEAGTELVKILGDIPGPVKAGALAFVGLTGGLIAVVKVSQLLVGVWGPIGRALAAAAVSAYGYITALASLAVTEGIAATASYALEGALLALSSPVLVVGAAIGVAALALIEWSTAADRAEDRANDTAAQADLIAKAWSLAQERGISLADALGIVEENTYGLTSALNDLKSVSGSFDPTELLAESPEVLDRITHLALEGSDALERFSKVSGVSVESIQNDLSSLATDAKATVGDFIAVIEDSRNAWREWHDQIVDNFGGASSALDQFVGKNKVDFGKISDSLKDYMGDLREWRRDFRELSKDPASKEFLQNASEGGLEWLGILDSVADQAPKARGKFFDLFNSANSGTESLATVIQNKLVPKFNTMIDRLEVIANKLGAHYKVDIDTSGAQSKLSALRAAIDSLLADLARINAAGANEPGHNFHAGGRDGDPRTSQAHGGFFPHRPGGYPITVGEGRHDEWVLNRPQLTGLMADHGSGGREQLVVLRGRLDPITGEIEAIARREDEAEARYRSRVTHR